jgi:hypothetical protein
MDHTAPIDVEREIEMKRKKAEYMKYENKVNVYLPSLMMKAPDYLYVLGDTYTCHTLIKYNQYA